MKPIRFTEPDDPDPPAQFMWTSLVVGVVGIGVVVVMAVAS